MMLTTTSHWKSSSKSKYTPYHKKLKFSEKICPKCFRKFATHEVVVKTNIGAMHEGCAKDGRIDIIQTEQVAYL